MDTENTIIQQHMITDYTRGGEPGGSSWLAPGATAKSVTRFDNGNRHRFCYMGSETIIRAPPWGEWTISSLPS